MGATNPIDGGQNMNRETSQRQSPEREEGHQEGWKPKEMKKCSTINGKSSDLYK